jgi:hypothetical protein
MVRKLQATRVLDVVEWTAEELPALGAETSDRVGADRNPVHRNGRVSDEPWRCARLTGPVGHPLLEC